MPRGWQAGWQSALQCTKCQGPGCMLPWMTGDQALCALQQSAQTCVHAAMRISIGSSPLHRLGSGRCTGCPLSKSAAMSRRAARRCAPSWRCCSCAIGFRSLRFCTPWCFAGRPRSAQQVCGAAAAPRGAGHLQLPDGSALGDGPVPMGLRPVGDGAPLQRFLPLHARVPNICPGCSLVHFHCGCLVISSLTDPLRLDCFCVPQSATSVQNSHLCMMTSGCLV